jgi:hypothetical protein
MLNRLLLLCVVLFLFIDHSNAQLDKYNTTDLHPVSPTAFQFLKYTEMPVSEYTGIPNITIPLYEIDVDEVKIPIHLSYHSQGIRVSQEASWVGLGWDMQMGSIIQNINDQDDYGTNPVFGTDSKIVPDFFPSNGDGSPVMLPLYNLDPFLGVPGAGWTNPYPINQPGPLQGYAVATNYYVPVNGQFNTQQGNLFGARYYDSEPDIFIASFFGETVKFILDFNNPGNFIVLNKKGYKVSKTTAGFTIMTRVGTTFTFETKTSIVTATSTSSFIGTGGSTTLGGDTTTNIYLLSKILTKNGKLITLGYSNTSTSFYSYLNCSQKLQDLTNGNTTLDPPVYGEGNYDFINFDSRAGSTFTGSGMYNDYSLNGEQYFYLQSINFPNGSVQFKVSGRSDIIGAEKLDSIKLQNLNGNTVKSWKLDYSYFNATGVGGNGYPSYLEPNLNLDSTSLLRLKLSDIKQDDGGIYNLIYDSAHLPMKNSFAQDYWGFYNGQLSNSSFVPNPTVLNLSALGNNGNVKDASLAYARGGILEGIQYPTGGKVNFDYELNVFDKTQMLGLPAAGTTIQGAGLRIHNISHFGIDGSLASKVTYNYGGGKLINRIQIVRQLNYFLLTGDNADDLQKTSYTLNEISANGVFSSSPLSSVNGVGYDTVTKQNIDAGNVTIGKTVTHFYNNIDNQNPTIASRALSCSLPSVKSNTLPENGSVQTIGMYDNQNVLLRTITNTYSISCSNIYYGGRILPYGALYYHRPDLNGSYILTNMPQNLIGYFPIFDVETLLASSFDTSFSVNGNTAIRTWNTYDAFNQLSGVTRTRSDGGIDNQYYYYPYSVTATPILTAMINNNRLSDLITVQKKINGGTLTYEYDKTFFQLSNKILESNVSIIQHALPSGNIPDTIVYELYDSTNANLLQFKTRAIRNSMIWDYSGQYLIAEVKNADFGSVAYTSFEANGKGNWTFTGAPVVDGTSPTGGQCYNLSSGNVSKTGLSTSRLFVVSYWSKNGSATVNGSTATGVITKKGWTYYEHQLASGVSTVTISGAVTIDELRLYPVDAQMNTYTFSPLVGMTSNCDISNRISYYEYDGVKRLKNIKDQDGNIVKTYDYHYQGQ